MFTYVCACVQYMGSRIHIHIRTCTYAYPYMKLFGVVGRTTESLIACTF